MVKSNLPQASMDEGFGYGAHCTCIVLHAGAKVLAGKWPQGGTSGGALSSSIVQPKTRSKVVYTQPMAWQCGLATIRYMAAIAAL